MPGSRSASATPRTEPSSSRSLLRVGRGTLSEMVGTGGLLADRMSRRLGFGRVAAATARPARRRRPRPPPRPTPRGINAGPAGRPAAPAARVRPAPRPSRRPGSHRRAGLRRAAVFALGANWDMELARLKILAEPTGRRRCGRWTTPTLPIIRSSVPLGDGRRTGRRPAGRGPGRLRRRRAVAGGGSNNWAIAGPRTASGVPLLANDPHLRRRLPAPWYLAHLRTPGVGGGRRDRSSAGRCFPIGHNGFAAWGITAGLTDTGRPVHRGDRRRRRRRCARARQVVPCQVLDEAIEVRGGETVIERVLLTRRGPIVSPFLDGRLRRCRCRRSGCARCRSAASWPVLRARDFETFRRGIRRLAGTGAERRLRRRRRSRRLPAGRAAAAAPARPRHAAAAGLARGRRLGGRAGAVRRDAAPCRSRHRLRGHRQQSPRGRRPRVRTWAWTGWTATAWPRIVEELASAPRLGRGRLCGAAARRHQRPVAAGAQHGP